MLVGLAGFVAPITVAQPADPVTDVARARYQDGVKAYDEGRFEDARNAFQQAYQLKGQPVILLNLGLAEVKSNHVAEGGNHLLQFLREYKQATPEDVAGANAGIEEAKKRCGQLAISVNQPGADVTIEGTPVGKSPFMDPLFADPGTRTVGATYAGTSTSAKVDVKKGQVSAVALAFGGVPVAPTVSATTTVTAPPVSTTSAPPVYPPGTGTVVPPPMQPPPGGDVSKNSFGYWYTHHPLVWVTTGLGVVGLGLGIGFSAAAGAAASNTDSIANQIRDEAKKRNITEPCATTDAGPDAEGFSKACTSLRGSIDTHDVDLGVGVAGWITFGLAAAGTVTYIMVDWFPKRNGTAASVEVTPVIGPGFGGVAGRF
ncbi:MAG: hypothetical protein U0414_34640 [Polyangiaceae bacterium]